MANALSRGPSLWRRTLAALIPVITAGCQGANGPPTISHVGPQEVTLGQSLAVELVGADPDGDPLTWALTGLPETAQVLSLSPQSARLLWSPLPEDATAAGLQYTAEVRATDGRGGVGLATFFVTVYPAYGIPTFDLPSGLVLNLAQEEDLKLEVRIKDADSTSVQIELLTQPDGAQLLPGGGKNAYLYWKPDGSQRQTPVHLFVFQASDDTHSPTVHPLMVALINAAGDAGCQGQAPTVDHTPPGDQAVATTGGLPLWVEVSDGDSLVATVTARWSVDGGPESAESLKATDEAKTSWQGTLPVETVAAGGQLLRYHLEVTDNDDPTGAACDHLARWPKTGEHTLGVYPPGSPETLCIDDPAEDDDTPSQASPLKPGIPVERRLCGADIDHLSLEAALGANVTATLVFPPQGAALQLQVSDPAGQMLTLAAGDGGVLSATAPVTVGGTHVLRISAPGGGARLTYTLEASTDALECPQDALEPNDTPQVAAPLGAGALGELRICPGDEDWYSFTFPEPSQLDVTLSFDHAHGDLDMELWDASGTTLLVSSASLASPEVLVHPAWEAPSVLLRIYGFAGDANGYGLQVTLSSLNTACPPDLFGLHDTAQDALILFSDVYSKLTTCADDPDWYAVDTNGGETVDLLVEPTSGAALALEVYNQADGSPVALGQDEGGLVVASYTQAEGGRLWYRISSSGAAGYDLLQAITDPPGPCEPDRFEPNDTANPADMAPGVHTWLRLCGQGDIDAFALELEPLQVLTVATLHSAGLGYGDLRIYGPTGTLLAEKLDFGTGVAISVLAETEGPYRVEFHPFAVADTLGYDLAIFIDGSGP